MAGAGVLEFNDDNFESEVINSDKAVLVDFWAPWCGPCRQIAPTVDALARENGDKVRIGKLNVDDSPKTSVAYNISGIPTLLLFKGGKEVRRFVGITSKDDLQKALNAAG